MAKIPYQIEPQGGGTISVEETMTEYDFGYSYTDTFTATPANGFVFDHWERTTTAVPSREFASRNNPWSEGYIEFYEGGSTGTTLVIAVFKPVHVPTGLILRYPGGLILRQDQGLILRDA